jgi:tryptophan-rich sensory protein
VCGTLQLRQALGSNGAAVSEDLMATSVIRRPGFPSLILFSALVTLAASAGILFEPGAWYQQLSKPSWNPPNWVFGPVWSALYLAIAVAGWLVWRRMGRMVIALHFWLAQLVLNWMWSFFFFGLHRPDLAFIDITLLLLAIVGFIGTARKPSVGAALLFVPYAAWVGFAGVLNFVIWQMNA